MPQAMNLFEFGQVVEKSELLDRFKLAACLDQLRHGAATEPTPVEAARAMVEERLITPFQARLLLQGKWRNFFIGGKYKVLEHLGAGGMGTVYLCEHRHMRRRVAIKLLSAVACDAPGTLERFRREAQAVSMLNHPNLVRAHDLDQDGPVHYLVMEFIDGRSLHQLVESQGPLAPERSINYIAQVASGLQHAHKARLVHRDVKPSNLLLDRTGVMKILDLGLARFEESNDHLTRLIDSKLVLGTADYLAPEQAISSDVDTRADIYSLGCTLYYLLAGRAPFADGNLAHKLIAHQTQEPFPIQRVRPDLPSGVCLVLAKMMAKRTVDRYQVPIDILRALSPWIVDVPPPTTFEMPAHSQRGAQSETLSKLSTIATLPPTTREKILAAAR